MSDSTPPNPPPFDDRRQRGRRGFFRAILLKGIDRAEQVSDSVQRRFERIAGPVQEDAAKDAQPLRYLRPPGALPAEVFADTCSGCGDCVTACPAQCIRIDADVADGLPYIIARESPCVVCTDLSCMKVCPTGALELVEKTSHILMGDAVVNHQTCVRNGDHASGGEDCTLCIVQCPEEERAIGLDSAGRVEVRDGCIGCGVCERVCPTEPASIWVEPAL